MMIGVDIGGTKMEIAVLDRDRVPLDRWRIATPQNDYASFVGAIAGLVAEADDRFGRAETVGLGIPGLVTADGRTRAANLPHTNGRRIAADVADLIGRPVASDNDCRCFALSESDGGAGTGYRTVFGAILGTGAAAGLVIDGRLVRGRQAIAGEYGHIPMSAAVAERHGLPVLPCGCGLRGCTELFAAGPGLMRLARHFGADAADVPALAAAWRSGDAAAVAVRDCALDLLGSVFATITMLVDPDVIVMGGGLSLMDDLVAALPDSIAQHLFAGFEGPPVVRAHFGDASGARGAAILAWREAAAR